MIRLVVAPISGHPWALSCTPSAYSEAVKVQMAAVPGIRWDRAGGSYVGAAEALAAVLPILRDAKVALCDWQASVLPPPPPAAFPALRDYQRVGAAWCATMLRTTGGALLADEMGIGKTAQAIAAAKLFGVASALVVSPAIVVPHWRAQIAKWGAELGGEPIAWRVLSYEGFTRAQGKGELEGLGVEMLIQDEAHYGSNPAAKRTKALREFAASCPVRPAILELSGTPMTTEPSDLWAPLDLLHPGRWGSRFAFQKRYCAGRFVEIPGLDRAAWVADGSSHVEELGLRLRSVMLRRTKAEVALELPPRTRQVIDVELPAKAVGSLRNAAAALNWSGKAAHGVGSLLSQVEAYKVTAAIALARDCLAAGSRPLILSNRKTTAETIADELRCPCATGDVGAGERRAALLSGTGAACSTIDAVTTGIDLVEFDCIIFTGLDWVPSKLLQAESRIHRLGQQRGVAIYYLVGIGSIDEVVRERVIERLEVFSRLADGDETAMAAELGGNDENLLGELVMSIKELAA